MGSDLQYCKGLVGLIIHGGRKLAYRHFDPRGDPSFLGDEIIRFIRSLSAEDMLKMRAKVEAVSTFIP